MPLFNNTAPQNRKQHIRIRDSTALMPAAFVESPIIKNEIVDIEYGELGSPARRVSSRPRVRTNKITQRETWTKKTPKAEDTTNDGNQQKSNKRKDTLQKAQENVSPPLKRLKFSQPGPMTSYLNRPFDRIQISEQKKQKIIKNQPILRLKRINECIVSIKSKKPAIKTTKVNQRTATTPATPPVVVREPTPVVREPVFIAVEDDNTEPIVVSPPNDSDTNISSTVMCRLCGVAGPNRFSLIGMRSEKISLLYHLKNYLNIEISDEENLPLHVCPLCSQTILSFYKFHGRVKTATNRLQAVVYESTSNPQRSWESIPWYGDNIIATATATNEYLTKKHLRKIEANYKGKGKSTSTKFITTNIEKLFGNKTKSNGINPDLIVEEEPFDNEDTADANNDTNDEDWLPEEPVLPNKSIPQKSKQFKNNDTSRMQVETITVDDDDEPLTSPKILSKKSTPVQQSKLQTMPRLVMLSKPPTMTPKPTTVNNPISILNSPITADNSTTGAKTFLIPIQNLVGAGLTGLNQGSQLKFALSANGQPILLQTADGGTNTLKFLPNQNNDKNIATKPLASIKGISNNLQNSIITSPTVNVSQILTTSNTSSIPIQTISPVATIVPNTTSSVQKPKPGSTVVVSQLASTNLQSKVKAVDKKTLVIPKVTSNASATSTTSSAKVINPLKNINTLQGKTITTPLPIKSTITKILTSTPTKPTSTPTSTKSSISTLTKPISISTSTKPTSTPSGKSNINKGKTTVTTSTTTSTKISATVSKSTTVVGSPITTTASVSKTKPEIADCLPLDPDEEKELNENFRAPSKDDKYTYVVRMDRNVGEQPYFILTANPVKLKSPDLTKHNVGIICKDVYKAEVEKKRMQENEGNFSNIGLHCWAQHIVWLWQLKLPGNVSMYVRQSADKILQFGQRMRIGYAKKCFEVSRQICTEAVIKSKTQSPQQAKKSTSVAATTMVVASTSSTLPRLTPIETKLSSTKDILPKLIPKDATVTNLLPKLLAKDSSTTSTVVTTQQLVLIPVTNPSKAGAGGNSSTVTYVISPNSNVKFQDILSTKSSSNFKLVSSTGLNPISSTKQQPSLSSEIFDMPQTIDMMPEDGLQDVTILNAENYETINDDDQMMDIIETIEVSTSDTTALLDDDANKRTEETNKIQLVYTDDDKDGDGMFDMECVSEEDDDHDIAAAAAAIGVDPTVDILKRATLEALGAEGIITDENAPNIQIETIDFDPTSEMFDTIGV